MKKIDYEDVCFEEKIIQSFESSLTFSHEKLEDLLQVIERINFPINLENISKIFQLFKIKEDSATAYFLENAINRNCISKHTLWDISILLANNRSVSKISLITSEDKRQLVSIINRLINASIDIIPKNIPGKEKAVGDYISTLKFMAEKYIKETSSASVSVLKEKITRFDISSKSIRAKLYYDFKANRLLDDEKYFTEFIDIKEKLTDNVIIKNSERERMEEEDKKIMEFGEEAVESKEEQVEKCEKEVGVDENPKEGEKEGGDDGSLTEKNRNKDEKMEEKDEGKQQEDEIYEDNQEKNEDKQGLIEKKCEKYESKQEGDEEKQGKNESDEKMSDFNNRKELETEKDTEITNSPKENIEKTEPKTENPSISINDHETISNPDESSQILISSNPSILNDKLPEEESEKTLSQDDKLIDFNLSDSSSMISPLIILDSPDPKSAENLLHDKDKSEDIFSISNSSNSKINDSEKSASKIARPNININDPLKRVNTMKVFKTSVGSPKSLISRIKRKMSPEIGASASPTSPTDQKTPEKPENTEIQNKEKTSNEECKKNESSNVFSPKKESRIASIRHKK